MLLRIDIGGDHVGTFIEYADQVVGSGLLAKCQLVDLQALPHLSGHS
jgi:hypothetical protein